MFLKKFKNRQFLVKLIYLIYLAFLTLAIDIIYTHYFEKIPAVRGWVYFQFFGPSIHQHSKINGLFYELKPNSETTTNNINFKINSWGMRDKETNLIKDCYRVLVMGDSVIFSPDVTESQLVTEVAEKIINAEQKKIEILNAGVSGYNTEQEFIALKEKYLKLKPDLVIFAYCTNDLSRAAIQYLPNDPLQKKMLQDGIGPDYTNLSELQYLALFLPNQFFLNYRFDRWLLLHSGIYRTISIKRFKKTNNIKDIRELPNFLFTFNFNQVLKNIRKLSQIHKFDLRFLILPTNEHWDRNKIISLLAKNKIKVWDLDTSAKKKLPKSKNLWITSPHLSVRGHLIVGELLAERLGNLISAVKTLE